MAENADVRVFGNHLSHISRRHEHVLQLVDVTVHTGDITTVQNLVLIYICTVLLLRILRTGKYLKVIYLTAFIRNADIVVHHLLTREVNHHRCSGVTDDVNTFIVKLCPILVIGRHARLSADMSDRVGHAHIRGMLHSHTLHDIACSVTYIRQHSDEQSIVEH